MMDMLYCGCSSNLNRSFWLSILDSLVTYVLLLETTTEIEWLSVASHRLRVSRFSVILLSIFHLRGLMITTSPAALIPQQFEPDSTVLVACKNQV